MAINVGPQPSQGVGGIPTRYVVIGAGVLGLAAVLLMQRKPSSAALPGDPQPTGSVSAQLSSVQQMQLSQFGELTKLFAHQEDAFGTQIGGLSTHLDTQAAYLSSLMSQIQAGETQNFNQTQTAWSNIMHGMYQTFMRTTNPSWMPGGKDDPWAPKTENTTNTTVSPKAA